MKDTYRLKFTGTCDHAEFERRVAEQSFWYHSYYFDNGSEVRGDYDIGADIDGYGFPADLRGLKVLDIGSGGGWFSFYFAQRGAEVTAVDARGYCDFDLYGRNPYPQPEVEGREPDRLDEEGRPVYYSTVSGAFWTMKDILGAKIRFRNARVYDVRPELFDGETFDLVFMGALLLHLRDPIGALSAARSVCRSKLIASSPVYPGEPEGEFAPRQYLPYTALDPISWWLPNEACFRHWFAAAGFREIDIRREVLIRMDKENIADGRVTNADQELRVAHVSV